MSTQKTVLNPAETCDKIAEQMVTVRPLTDADLERIERQLIPLLNTVRAMRGKRPVIVPGTERVTVG